MGDRGVPGASDEPTRGGAEGSVPLERGASSGWRTHSATDPGDETLPAASSGELTVAASSAGFDHDRVLERGDEVGRYCVVQTLGAGGMGIVYEAEDPELDRRIAIKLLHSGGAGTQRNATRDALLQEARTVARLSHPNLVTVMDVGVHGGRVFMAMELLRGSTLGSWLQQRRPWREVIRIFVEAGRGLAAAHEAGVVHRDFKPANVFLCDDGRVVVMDFGIAVSSDAGPEPTDEDEAPGFRTAAGTPRYLAPERVAGLVGDARSDQFSFCVALFEALYGAHPFDTESLPALFASVSEGRVRQVDDRGDVPGRLEEVVQRGLSADPDARHPSMQALVDALEREARVDRKKWWLAAAVAVVGLGVAATISYQPAASCTDEVERMWNAERGKQVEAAFAQAGGDAEPVVGRMDELVRAYEQEHEQACADEGAARDLRLSCLDRLLSRYAAVAGAFATVDEALMARTSDVLRGLPEPATCRDPSRLRTERPTPDDPNDAAEVEQVRKALESVAGLVQAARYEEAWVELEPLVQRARVIGFAPLQAEVSFLVGRVQSERSHHDEAYEAYVEAHAKASGVHEEMALRSAISLAWMSAEIFQRFDEADRWISSGRALLERAPSLDAWRAELIGTEANLCYLRRDLERSLELYRQTAAAFAAEEDAAEQRAAVATNIGHVLLDLGRPEEALASFREALQLWTPELPANHPDLALAYNNIGVAFDRLGRYDEALREYERALDIWRAALGPEHTSTAFALMNVANMRIRSGNIEEGVANLRAIRALVQDRLDPKDPRLQYLSTNLAIGLEEAGLTDEALTEYANVVRVVEQLYGADHPEVGNAEGNYAGALCKAGRAEEGERHARRAVEVLADAPSDERAGALAHLAGCELEAERPDDARRHATEAIALLDTDEGPPHPRIAWFLETLGHAELARGEVDAAIEALERAVEASERLPSNEARAHHRFALAKARWDTRRDRHRAITLAREASELSPDDPEITTWLRAHPSD